MDGIVYPESAKPREIATRSIEFLAPYYWRKYRHGSQHQVENFLDPFELNAYNTKILDQKRNELFRALDNYLKRITEHNKTLCQDWDGIDFIEFDDLVYFRNLSARDQVQAIEKLLQSMPLTRPIELTPIDELARENRWQQFLTWRVLDAEGQPIDKTANEKAWLATRLQGVTATDANKLIKLNRERRTTWQKTLTEKIYNLDSFYSEYFDLGIEREPIIAEWAIDNFEGEGFVANSWLFRHESEELHLATPDLVGKYTIGEIKVSTKPLRETLSKYRDQLQWQMNVMQVNRMLFIVENRHTQEIEHDWIEADEKRISELTYAAEEFLTELQDEKEMRASGN